MLHKVCALILGCLSVLRAEEFKFLSHFDFQLTQKLVLHIANSLFVEQLQRVLFGLLIPLKQLVVEHGHIVLVVLVKLGLKLLQC